VQKYRRRKGMTLEAIASKPALGTGEAPRSPPPYCTPRLTGHQYTPQAGVLVAADLATQDQVALTAQAYRAHLAGGRAQSFPDELWILQRIDAG
jgi:hypothetical protein